MHFGVLLLFANANSGKSDQQLWKEEMDLGVKAEELGFDSVWAPEHHFDRPYCESPDPLTALTYLAAKTTKIKLGTGAIILPWWQGHNDAMRLAERIAIVDHLSDGRLLLGLGRGLARREYEGFGVDMEESRDRFNETAEMLLQGLDTGSIESDGKFFKQSKQDVFPEPAKNFRDRTYVIAMSPPSIRASAEFGGTLMCFNYQYPIDQQATEFQEWRDLYERTHNKPAPPPVLLDFMHCHEDAGEADAIMRDHLGPFFNAMVDHYEFDGKHFASSEKYNHYASGAEAIQAAGREAAFEGFFGLQWTGAPDKMIEQMKERIDLIGDFSQMVLVSFGGLSQDKVYKSLELFQSKVVPAVQAYAAKAGHQVTVNV
ncbi:LLM class flavin-dependent oxidoreductase [Sporichthya sp.]|uniref:LLM class flavin-dependent oxidoreductase n=1 Tax=Sporichthya sp. TaxID=65475 RepID=UPI001797B892|nr:LLM class flavin-dependent oxidoreductase [Sporichthya sp.]MBA3743707.1 LLM class flavin-dependent oxidoreductase [Sporichthya sp.]